MADVDYSTSLVGVDWAALKAALVAGDFDNLRTPEQYQRSYEQSHSGIFARDGDVFAGTARLLSDGVCNAYLVDVWTAPAYRLRGIGAEMVRRLLEGVPGQHVGLFTDEAAGFYAGLGFTPQRGGMSRIVGTWLSLPE